MATRSITVQAATIGEVIGMQLRNPADGPAFVEANVASPASGVLDIRRINLTATSLTSTQRSTLVNLLGIILADMQALDVPEFGWDPYDQPDP